MLKREKAMRTLPDELISLLQYVELNKSNWWEDTVDRSVLAILWLDDDSYSPQKIKFELENRLGFSVRLYEVQASIKRLSDQGIIVPNHSDQFCLTLEEKKILRNQVDNSKNQEKMVVEQFEKTLGPVCPNIDLDFLWNEFKQKFIIPLVSDLGIRVYEFFTKKRQDLPWISFIENFLEIVPNSSKLEVQNAISSFMDPTNDALSQFILDYLDAYLLISAYGLSTQTLQSLKKVSEGNIEFVVFLDTNVIFSLLDLHTNPSNETVLQLMELVQSIDDSLKISFVISPITLLETQDAIKFYRDQLNGSAYSVNLAEAAKIVGVSGVYRRYFERVEEAGRQINVSDYFDPYLNQLVPLLNSKSVHVFSEGDIDKYEKLPKVFQDIDLQKRFEDERYKREAKGIDQITKDVVLWHFVSDLRPSQTTSPLSAKYWVLTIDYRFLSFDRYKKKGADLVSVCIQPSQLIQLLRFFIPTSPQIGKILLGTIITPLLSRGLDGKAEQTVIRILRRLSRYEGIEDIPVEVISKLLTDENLKSQLSKIDGEEEENTIIREHIATELAQASKEIKEKEVVIESKEKQLENLAEKYTSLEKSSLEKINDLTIKLDQQQSKIDNLVSYQLTVDELKKKTKAFSNFRKLMSLYFIPYLILVPLAWFGIASFLLREKDLWLSYLVFGVLLILISIFSIKFILEQGAKEKYISNEKWYGWLQTKAKFGGVIWFVVSTLWTFFLDFIKSLLFN